MNKEGEEEEKFSNTYSRKKEDENNHIENSAHSTKTNYYEIRKIDKNDTDKTQIKMEK